VIGVVLLALFGIGCDVAREAWLEHRAHSEVLGTRDAPLQALHVNPAWILAGSPSFEARSYSDTPEASTSAGIWQCTGPGKFRWEYSIDETLYVLEGDAELEYGGAIHRLTPGTAAFFPAGSLVIWNVPHGIRKTFSIHEPGRVRRLLRKLFFPAPPQP
jgi:uncharacterized cupin superfamily protein